MTIALIINPFARRNRNGADAGLIREAENLGIALYRIEDFAALPELVTRMMAEAPDMVIVSGGDGTAHAVISLLGERDPDEKRPLLALLPHGTTNVTALQVSLRKPDPRQLRRLAAPAGSRPPTCRKHTVRVANLTDQPPLHGFINAVGVIASGTARCQTNLNQSGWTGNFAVALSMINDLIKKVLSRDPEAGGLLTPVSMRLTTADGRDYDEDTLTILISTLDRLVLGSSPFWNLAEGALHVTRVSKNPPDFITNLYRILFGNKHKLPASHFQSFSGDALTLTLDGEVLIDGEFYTASSQVPLEISAGPEFEFVRL